MKAFIQCLLVVCICVSVCEAQNCNLSVKGKITDANSVNALDDATVVVKETQQSTFTDDGGRFQLTNLCVGKVTIMISHIGCETQLVEINLQHDTVLRIKLNHKEEELNTVEVTAAKKESHETQSALTIESVELDQLRGLSLGETLKKIPGIYSLNTGATVSKPVIHGLHSNRVLIMNNGVRLESQQWGSEHAPEIDAFIAKKITVVKGANSLRYGSDAIGGVILVDPNPLPQAHGIGGEINFVGFSNNAEGNLSATIEGCHHRIPALAWRVQGTYRRGGNSRAPEYWLGNTGIEEGNLSAALGYKEPRYGIEFFFSRFQTKIGILSAAHIGNITDLLTAIERENPNVAAKFSYKTGKPYQQVTHYLAKARVYFQNRKGDDFSLTVAWQDNERNEFDVPHFYRQDKDRPGFYFQIQTINTDFEWRHKQVKNLSGALGVNAVTQTNNFRYAYFIPDFWSFGGGVFAMERWSKNNFELEGGLRFDYKWGQYFVRNNSYRFDTALNFFAPSGNIGFEHHAKENFTWRMNFGSAFRAPASNELFASGVHHGAATYETGNRYMKPEQSFNLSTSFDYKTNFIQLSAEFYTNYILHFINLVPVQPPKLTIRGAFPSFEYRQQNALLSGSDIDLVLQPHKGLEFFNKTSLLFARNTDTHDWLEQMPPIRLENGVRYTATLRKALKEISGGVSVVNVLKQSFIPESANDYAPPPPAYFLLNFEVNARFEVNNNKFSIGVTVENAANMKYRDYLDRFRYFADARGVNAALRLKYEFFASQH